jgi:hypothetical protein
MAITSRALAFASRWFDPATVHSIFEPLVADWQRDWQDAPRSHRRWASLRGLLAFLTAVLVSSPRIAMTSAPPELSNRVVKIVARFTIAGAALLTIPFWLEMNRAWTQGLLVLFILPGAMVMALPFSMIAAADALRSDDKTPGHVARALALKVGATCVLLMIGVHGWVVPASNVVWRRLMAPTEIGVPQRGVRELNTFELISDPARATAFEGTNAWGRAAIIRRELNNRAHLAVLPALLLWLRWGMLDETRRKWYAPLPSWLMTPVVIVGFVTLNYAGINLVRSAHAQGNAVWLPAAGILCAGFLMRSRFLFRFR